MKLDRLRADRRNDILKCYFTTCPIQSNDSYKSHQGKSSTDLTVHRYSLILAQCDWSPRPSPCVNSGTRCDLCLSKFLLCLSGKHATAPTSRYWKAEENSLLVQDDIRSISLSPRYHWSKDSNSHNVPSFAGSISRPRSLLISVTITYSAPTWSRSVSSC